MNVKKYIIMTFLLFLSTAYSMERIVVESEKDDSRIAMPSSRLNKNSSPGVLIGLKSSQLGNKDKKIPQDGRDLRNLIKTRSVPAQMPTRGSRVPAFDKEKFDQVKNKTYKTGKHEYTYDDVVTLLSQVITSDECEPLISQRLHELGVKNNVSLDRLKQHAQLFSEVEVTPRTLADAVYLLIGEKDKKPENFEVKRYEKVAQESPAKYEELVFSLFEALLNRSVEKGSGITPTKVVPTDLVDFHAGALTSEIQAQKEARRQWIFAAVTTVMGWILTGVGWGIQSQYCDIDVNDTQVS